MTDKLIRTLGYISLAIYFAIGAYGFFYQRDKTAIMREPMITARLEAGEIIIMYWDTDGSRKTKTLSEKEISSLRSFFEKASEDRVSF